MRKNICSLLLGGNIKTCLACMTSTSFRVQIVATNAIIAKPITHTQTHTHVCKVICQLKQNCSQIKFASNLAAVIKVKIFLPHIRNDTKSQISYATTTNTHTLPQTHTHIHTGKNAKKISGKIFVGEKILSPAVLTGQLDQLD